MGPTCNWRDCNSALKCAIILLQKSSSYITAVTAPHTPIFALSINFKLSRRYLIKKYDIIEINIQIMNEIK